MRWYMRSNDSCVEHSYAQKKVCCVYQHSLKRMAEIPGQQPLHEWSWTALAAGLVFGSLCKEEWEELFKMTTSRLLVCMFVDSSMMAQCPVVGSVLTVRHCAHQLALTVLCIDEKRFTLRTSLSKLFPTCCMC